MNFSSNLTIVSDDKVVFETSNTQKLYLYPLTLKDYVLNIKNMLPIKLDILKVNKNIDYKNLLNNKHFNNLLCVELNINNKKDLNIIKNIIHILYDKRIKISLNIKNYNEIPLSFFKEVLNYISYFKIHFDYSDMDKLIKRIKTINNSMIHIKSYLKLEEIDNYEKYIESFEKSGVNIYQLSKELLPVNKNNITIDEMYEERIRNLEVKYSSGRIVFKSVKNLKELYYPRFELDERNSRNCYACKLKPYLYDDILLPCKVNEKLNNTQIWGTKDYNNLDCFNNCGIKCDDCASIYENDILDEIYNIVKDKKITVREV